eukprot:CAMPEP_0206144950 /NCGR_PEP_ID=MMETSP1473-20131121/25946_1 /ASSEMBLY_ACC=CAM_ASM_001109 /TAXON_ID=1461547 /ORGANISM="Stichococcus sp, Strain RCC1054" /LENGTH=420 /DNA_ID=CAMNT_0053540981 /DNA_START=367 /DNA_END=1629 /DNA_ORIENTATION=+
MWTTTTEASHSQHTSKFSNEFRRACDSQLRQLQTALRALQGANARIGDFSVFVRVPSSLEQGDLSLQRVAHRGDRDFSKGYTLRAEDTTVVQLQQDGPGGSKREIEEWINQHRSFQLPGDAEAVVFPLTFMPHQQRSYHQPEGERRADAGTLLGLLVVEGAGLASASLDVLDSFDEEEQQQQQWDHQQAFIRRRYKQRYPPLAIGASHVFSDGPTSFGRPPIQPPLDTFDNRDSTDSLAALLLEQACECLVMSCALELRLYLERGALLASQQTARSLVDQARKPLSALRSFGNMLQMRTPAGQVEGDMANNIMIQGNQLHNVLQQLTTALHPHPHTTSAQQIISGSSRGRRPAATGGEHTPSHGSKRSADHGSSPAAGQGSGHTFSQSRAPGAHVSCGVTGSSNEDSPASFSESDADDRS